MSVPDAAYLAGVIDADGTIGLYRKSRNGGAQYVLQVGISSTRVDHLSWVLETTGVGMVAKNRAETERTKATWQWLAINRGAMSVLEQVAPYMRVKDDRVVLARSALRAMLLRDLETVEEYRLLFTHANQTGPPRH